MKHRSTGLLALAVLFSISTITQVQGQSREAEKRHAEPYYSVTKEVTLTGTVSSVLGAPSAGMIAGSHLLLTTPAGQVDASLGRWGLHGKGALAVAAGDQVEVTGVMKTLLQKQVFVVRTVKVGGQVYTIRSEYGISVSPQTRERLSQKITQKGETL